MNTVFLYIINVSENQRENQEQLFKEEHTLQWLKEKRKQDQCSKKHYIETTRPPQKKIVNTGAPVW